jgi:hypothetical protein
MMDRANTSGSHVLCGEDGLYQLCDASSAKHNVFGSFLLHVITFTSFLWVGHSPILRGGVPFDWMIQRRQQNL